MAHVVIVRWSVSEREALDEGLVSARQGLTDRAHARNIEMLRSVRMDLDTEVGHYQCAA
jgi:hypothetical protein